MYDDNIQVAKRKSKGTVRKESSDRTSRRESRQSRKPMHPISRALSSSTPIQMVRFADHEYKKTPGTYTWTHEDQARINTAIANALTHLVNAHNYVINSRSNLAIIDNAIKAVYNVLSNDTLSIFPLSNRNSSYGVSAKGACEISISLKHNRTPFDFSKTLVHEAFHIIGGCMKYKNNQTDKRMIDSDITCEDDMEQIDALKYIMPHDDIIKIPADLFAQFVMKCE